jgi:hypothetical protein
MLGDYANESMYLLVSILFIRSPLVTSSWNDALYYNARAPNCARADFGKEEHPLMTAGRILYLIR